MLIAIAVGKWRILKNLRNKEFKFGEKEKRMTVIEVDCFPLIGRRETSSLLFCLFWRRICKYEYMYIDDSVPGNFLRVAENNWEMCNWCHLFQLDFSLLNSRTAP